MADSPAGFSTMGERTKTPAALGYRMPAEWERHESTWISWPHNPETWPGALEEAEHVMARAVEVLSAGEKVRINVLDESHRRRVESLINPDAVVFPVEYHLIPTNDAWCRDHGAIFVTRAGSDQPVAATSWNYNAWGGKYPPWDLDDAVSSRMAEVLGTPFFSRDMVLEGGSIEVNGAGLLMTTASCLLNPNRNPGLTEAEAESVFGEMLGIRKTLWLHGDIAGDDTDGHIDNLARFVAAEVVVSAVEQDPADPSYASLRENADRLARATTASGDPIRVVELPMPEPVFADGVRLPASYANFYIGNRVLLLPGYSARRDRIAAETLQEHFPDRMVVTLDCRDLVRGLGAFHCLTQQVPLGGDA
jgi:agmatine deiminase